MQLVVFFAADGFLLRWCKIQYGITDLDKTEQFLKDFGMWPVEAPKHDRNAIRFFRGYGNDPYIYVAKKTEEPTFLGGSWLVSSEKDLEEALKLPGATGDGIVSLDDRPGGGKQVTLMDPDGFPINLVYGQQQTAPLESPDHKLTNFPHDKPRPVGKFQRFEQGPCPIHMLGHYGQSVKAFAKSYEWYTTTFNFVASDILHADDGKEVGVFLHLDLGKTPTPHHSFFFMEMPTQHVHHCSFEVHDTDSQMLGHQHLEHQGYELCWGVGRHILGSQIFDYWFGPDRFMIEHYCDSDYVNDETPTGHLPAKDETLAIWGPKVPETFLT